MREEAFEIYGRTFTFRFIERPDLRRVEVEILEGQGGLARVYVRVPVRGRDADDARDRAVEVVQNYAGLDRYLSLVAREVRAVAPGAEMDVTETAQDIRIALHGMWQLSLPLVLVREDALDPERTDDELSTFVRTHLRTHLMEAGDNL